MLDEDLKAWLLEINMSPCMDQYTCKGQMACAHKDCPISPVDRYVKTTVLFDTINLMVRAKDLGGAHLVGDRYRSLTRLFPSENPEHMEVHDRLRDLRILYMTVTRGRGEMSLNDFVKTFCKSKVLAQQCGVKKVDLNILF